MLQSEKIMISSFRQRTLSCWGLILWALNTDTWASVIWRWWILNIMSNACFCIITRGLCLLIIIFTILILSDIVVFPSLSHPLVYQCVYVSVCVTGNDYHFDSHQCNSSLIKTKAPEKTAINTIISVSVCVCVVLDVAQSFASWTIFSNTNTCVFVYIYFVHACIRINIRSYPQVTVVLPGRQVEQQMIMDV